MRGLRWTKHPGTDRSIDGLDPMETVHVLRQGGSVTLKLPEDFAIEGDRFLIKQQGRAIVLLPADDPWRPLIDTLGRLTEDFMVDRDQPEHQIRPGLEG